MMVKHLDMVCVFNNLYSILKGGNLRKLAKRTTLFALDGPDRKYPVIDWCDQLT